VNGDARPSGQRSADWYTPVAARALGRSNQDIDDDLGISATTVGHHVEHVDQKPGVRSRAAATLWAFEPDLVRTR
jgi:DNA-binding NarL/FixJ family response regulator